MKYVIVIDNQGEESPILFPECINHNGAVNHLRTVVVSAGFCFKEDGKWKAQGLSESLRKNSRPEDSELIQRYFK
jgi:hypothetical protein